MDAAPISQQGPEHPRRYQYHKHQNVERNRNDQAGHKVVPKDRERSFEKAMIKERGLRKGTDRAGGFDRFESATEECDLLSRLCEFGSELLFHGLRV